MTDDEKTEEAMEDRYAEALSIAIQYVPLVGKDISEQKDIDRIHELTRKPQILEKPETLELWVNVYEDESVTHKSQDDAESMLSIKAIRSAVHMREVETVEPLESGVWHGITAYLEARFFPETEQILIRDNDEGQDIAVHKDFIPALIIALRGLMKGEQS